MELDEHLKTIIVDIIQKNWRKSPLSVIEWNVASGSKKGDNYIGIVKTINVVCISESNTRHEFFFMLKQAPESIMYRKAFPIEAAFKREVFIYENVLPNFQKLQDDFCIKNQFRSFAPYYCSSLETGREFIIMDNMKHLNYFMCDRKQVMDFDHSLIVFKELGRLHSLSFAMKAKNPTLFKNIAGNCKEIFLSINNFDEISQSFKNRRQPLLELFDPVKEAIVINKIDKFYNNSFRDIFEMIAPEAAGDYAVITHGDSWINNFLFAYQDENNNKPNKLCFLDWQLSRFGSPVLDLVYYLFACTDQEFRDMYMDKLFEEYHKSLSDMLNEFGYDANKLFPFTVLMDHYRKFAKFGFAMAILIIYLIISDSDEIPDFVELCDSGSSMANSVQYENRNVEVYNKRIRDLAIYVAQENLI